MSWCKLEAGVTNTIVSCQNEAWSFDWAKINAAPPNITKIEKAGSERDLLSLLLLKIQKLDPDVIIGHDVSTFDLEVLIHRMQQNKIPQDWIF